MPGLPQGAKVLLVLGEIDCREGLLMAVEKMKVSFLLGTLLLAGMASMAYLKQLGPAS
jgi:hypothetical protein